MLNAAAAFLVADKVETLREGVELAGAVLDDGRPGPPWPAGGRHQLRSRTRMTDILAKIAAYKREDVADRKRRRPSPRSTPPPKSANARAASRPRWRPPMRPASWP
jgi:hypothetical protein